MAAMQKKKADQHIADDEQKETNSKKANAATSALDLLEQDHTEVEGLFEEYEELEDASQKQALALKICLALQVHTQIEEEIFYPAVREAIDKTALIDEALVEHASAKQLIAEIEEMDAGDELYDAKVKVLGEQVSHHIEEVGSSRVDLQACKLEYSIVSPK